MIPLFMKKYARDLRVIQIEMLRDDYLLLRLAMPDDAVAEILPGQFVQVAISGSSTTFLRRPISINDVDVAAGTFDLLIHIVGDGTRALARSKEGDTLNCIYPLGNGFPVPDSSTLPQDVLLVGGGVGTAPMLYYGRCLHQAGHRPTFLLGGRSARDLLQLERFAAFGQVLTTTEDGSYGEPGRVTQHSVWTTTHFDRVAACGPMPMMKAVAQLARSKAYSCLVSLENMMACGVGACLCCVEKTVKGNVCVCTEGPVFDIQQLTW